MKSAPRTEGFTLIELLVCVGIIAILAASILPAIGIATKHAHSAGCCSNMRSLGVGFMSYAGDHDAQLPGRVTGSGLDKWPALLLPYVGNSKTYVDPGDTVATKVAYDDLVSNSANNSSFFFNGFNDLGHFTNPTATVMLQTFAAPGQLLLLGQKMNGNTQYYMDFDEGNENDVLNKKAYFGGSNYVFADGSAKWIVASDYNDTMWLVNKAYPIPAVPGH